MTTSRRGALMSHFEGDPPSRTPGKECGRGGGSADSPADQLQAPDVLEVPLVVAIDQPGLYHPDREPGEAPAGAVVPSCLSAGARPTAVSLRERHTAVAATGRAVSSPPAPVRPVGTPTEWW